MTSALSLLITAQMLLAAVIGNPALPEDFKANAIQIANNAILVANEEIAEAQTPPAPVSQVTPQPQPVQVGAIIPPMEKKIIVDTEARYENANGPYLNLFVYYLENGVKKSGVTITASADDGGELNGSPTGPNGYRDGSPAAHFVYLPKEPGQRTLTFTVGETTATIEVRGR